MRPTVYMLVGPPGCGKSYYANKLSILTKGIILSSDSIRKELYGDESIQDNPNLVFDIRNKRMLEELDRGNSVILDSTNLSRKNRKNTIDLIKDKSIDIQAHIIFCPISLCIERDFNRDRAVGKDIILRMLKGFKFPYYDEGFSKIKIITNVDDNQLLLDFRTSLDIPQENKHHKLSLSEHMKESGRYCIAHNFDLVIVLAAFYHDVGKLETKFIKDGEAHYYGHQGVSAYKAMAKTSNIDSLWLISSHMEPYFNSKYYKNLPNYMKTSLDKLHEADVYAH